LDLTHIDGDRVDFYLSLMAFPVYDAFFTVYLCLRYKLLHCIQKTLTVLRGLETQQVGMAKGRANLANDVVGNHLPVAGGGPGNMNKVLDQGFGEFLAHVLRHEVKVIVMADDERGIWAFLGFLYYCPGKGLVHWHVPTVPGLVNAGIHVRVVGRIPHVMLEKPEERVTKNVVVLVINPARGDHVAEVDFVARQRRLEMGGTPVVGNDAVPFSHSAGYPGKLGSLGQRVEGRDNAAATPAGLRSTLWGHLVFHRAAIAC
jgi:hypothetical protein